jgi:hypothetical protein
MRAAPVLSGRSVVSLWLVPSGNSATLPPAATIVAQREKIARLWAGSASFGR